MATITKDPMSGAYIVKPGDDLTKISSATGRTLQELLSLNPQYRAPTPTGATNLIRPGQTVNLGGGFSLPQTPTSAPTPAPANSSSPFRLPEVLGQTTNTPSTTSFTKALIDILKEGQGINQTGQAKLMKQSQDIKGQALGDSARTFNNKYLAPNSGTSLGLSAQNEFDPATLSIENQQKLATANLGNITDLVDRTQESYDKEQERLNDLILAQLKDEGGGDDLLSVTEAQALGVPYGTTKSQAYGLAVTGSPTVDQSKARQFAVAAENANNILNNSNYKLGAIENPYIPNALKSQDRQTFEQAARAFVNATLRRESGATITDSEFLNKYRELIPAAGDGEKVLAQKAQARAAAVQTIKEAGGNMPTNTSTGGAGITPDEEIFLRNQGYSEQEINALKTSFNSVGGDTNIAIRSLDDAMSRISRNESGGNYQALGPTVTKGQYAGERALGKYQVMPGNLPEWSKAALGVSISPQQFLANPELQERIVADRMSRIYQQYGNWNDVASVWFTGKPAGEGANKRDVLGTSGAEYLRRFNV